MFLARSVLFDSRKKVNLQINYYSTTITRPSVLVKMEEKRSWRCGRGGGGLGGERICGERGCEGGLGGYVKENEGECKDSLFWQKSS